jgi:hypothetical protein
VLIAVLHWSRATSLGQTVGSTSVASSLRVQPPKQIRPIPLAGL